MAQKMMYSAHSLEQIAIAGPQDIVKARGSVRALAAQLDLGVADQTRLATAVSELARNVIQYAGSGTCTLSDCSDDDYIRIRVIVEDHGPGIPSIDMAMKDGFSTSNGLGAGLPGTRRLMDSFSIESVPGLTTISIMLVRERLREKLK